VVEQRAVEVEQNGPITHDRGRLPAGDGE